MCRASQKYDHTKDDGGIGLDLGIFDTLKIDSYFSSSNDNRITKGIKKIKNFCYKIDLKDNVKSEAIKIFKNIAK